MNQSVEAFDKCKKVILSCKNNVQLERAEKYFELYKEMWGYDFELHLVYQAKFMQFNRDYYDNH